MDILKIKQLVNSNLPEDLKKDGILVILANDKQVIPLILKILEKERFSNKELIIDMNEQLSRAHICLESGKEKEFVMDKISEFYIKYKTKIKHCFNRFN